MLENSASHSAFINLKSLSLVKSELYIFVMVQNKNQLNFDTSVSMSPE